MKKNNVAHIDDIDLNKFLKIIWDEKIKIVLITFVSFLIALGYSNSIPNTFENSINLKVAKNKDIKELHEIHNYLFIGKEVSYLGFGKSTTNNNYENNGPLSIDKKKVEEEFLNEIMDYEEIVNVLENNKTFIKEISQLSRANKQRVLYDYASSLNVKKKIVMKMESDYHILKFIWADAQEASDIIDQTLKLVSINLEKSIFQHLDSIVQIKKNQDEKRLEFLLEQSLLARELKIEYSDFRNFSAVTGFSDPYTLNTYPYYQKGYIAIDKEIELLKKRNFQTLTKVEEKINILKERKINWIDYSIFLLETKSLKNSKTIHMASVFLSFMIGVLYVLISRRFLYQKVSSNKLSN
jgi:hypothetical protein